MKQVLKYYEGYIKSLSKRVFYDVYGNPYVYVDEDGARVRRLVKIGKVTAGVTQILEGLEEGEVVYVKD